MTSPEAAPLLRKSYGAARALTAVALEKTNEANGMTRDLQGRIVSAEHLTRRVTRYEPDGSITHSTTMLPQRGRIVNPIPGPRPFPPGMMRQAEREDNLAPAAAL